MSEHHEKGIPPMGVQGAGGPAGQEGPAGNASWTPGGTGGQGSEGAQDPATGAGAQAQYHTGAAYGSAGQVNNGVQGGQYQGQPGFQGAAPPPGGAGPAYAPAGMNPGIGAYYGGHGGAPGMVGVPVQGGHPGYGYGQAAIYGGQPVHHYYAPPVGMAGPAYPPQGGTGQRAGHARGAGVSAMVEEIANGGNGLSSLSKILDFDDKEFWKGALLGAAAVLLLTNESVQETLFRTGAKAKEKVKSGVDKVREKVHEATEKNESEATETKGDS